VSATASAPDVVRELRAICGETNVVEHPAPSRRPRLDDTVDLGEFGVAAGTAPPVEVTPGSVEEIAAVLQMANEHGLSVTPVGGVTELNPGRLRTDIVLHTARLTQVEHYDHADLTVGVGAGMTVAQLSSMVSADKLLFALDPALPERATIGGVLAAASHGPLRQGYGALRDFCIGIRFVTGDGRKGKGGGRVVKNVAGYDMMKLLIGSYGTLAVITSASFKLFPAPRQTRTFLAEFATATEALKFRDMVLRSPLDPMCLELVSPGARRWMRPEMQSDSWAMCLRASGSDTVLARYRKELGSAVMWELAGDDERNMWSAITNFPIPADINQSPLLTHSFLRLNATVPLHKVASVISAVEDFAVPGSFDFGVIGRVGVGHVLASAWPADADICMHDDAFVDHLLRRVPCDNLAVTGSVTPWASSPPNLASMRAVKRALDPKNVLQGRSLP